MTGVQMHQAEQDVICLVGCAVRGETPDPERLADLDAVYTVASRHMLTAAVAIALERAGLKDARSSRAIAASLRKRLLFEQEMGRVKAELEAAGIWYMPLKGAVLQSFYPVSEMREFSDYDILIDAERAADVKAVMEGLGFTTKSYNRSCHDVYLKPPFFNFQMHISLFNKEYDGATYQYFRDVGNRLTGAGCEKHFTPEDFYLYMLAHEYKHYSTGGTGLRSLLDTYVYLSRVTPDWAYVAAEAEKLGLSDFEKANRSLALQLFGGGELTEADRAMLDYVLRSGAYGNWKHAVENQLAKMNHSRKKYFLSQLAPPYGQMLKRYPILRKMPFLYPACWLHRLVYGLLFYRKIILYQLRVVLGLKQK